MARTFAHLTRKNIRTLKCGERISEGGIVAECLPNGDIRYSVNVQVDGQRIHRAIGKESEGVTRTQCEDFISAARTAARENRLNLPTGRKTALTFRKAAEQYLEKEEETGGRNLVAKKRHVEQRLTPYFKDQRLDAITSFTLDKYKRKRLSEGAKAGTVNRELTTLSHLFSKAVEWKWIRERPAKVVKLAEGPGRLVALTEDECTALMKAAIGDQDGDVYLFVAFALNTAMRHREILRARFDHVDFDRLRLMIPEAKAGARWQPITQELADILKREQDMRDDQKGWIFPARHKTASKKPHRDRISRGFRRTVKRAGMDPAVITPHVLRHTAITHLVQSGADLLTVQRISGHKTLAMVKRYTHLADAHVDSAMKALGRTLPEPEVNKAADTASPKLHTFPRKKA